MEKSFNDLPVKDFGPSAGRGNDCRTSQWLFGSQQTVVKKKLDERRDQSELKGLSS